MTVRCMRIAYRKPKSTNTHSEYVILVAFSLQQWSHKRACMLCYKYIACPVLNVFLYSRDEGPLILYILYTVLLICVCLLSFTFELVC